MKTPDKDKLNEYFLLLNQQFDKLFRTNGHKLTGMKWLPSWLKRADVSIPNLSFGRYTDYYKAESKLRYWDEAMVQFSKGQTEPAFENVFKYLTDDDQENLVYKRKEDGGFVFKLYQGSKIVYGSTGVEYFTAEAKIARCIRPNLSVFRNVLEHNYELKHAKYCLDEEYNLTVLFQTSHLDANPYKLYYGLKEVASIADYRDDALISSYEEFEPIQSDHVRPIDTYLVRAKYEYFTHALAELLNQITEGQLTARENLGGFTYRIGSFIFALDYLLLPESKLMMSLEKMLNWINNSDSGQVFDNVALVLNELRNLEKTSFDAFKQEFYRSKYTFGTTEPANHQHLVNLVASNQEQLTFFTDQRMTVLSNAVCGYVLGKLIYENALPLYDKEFIHLYYRIAESAFFTSCGFPPLVKNEVILRKEVLEEIERISAISSKNTQIKVDTSLINWSRPYFGPSFLLMLARAEILSV